MPLHLWKVLMVDQLLLQPLNLEMPTPRHLQIDSLVQGLIHHLVIMSSEWKFKHILPNNNYIAYHDEKNAAIRAWPLPWKRKTINQNLANMFHFIAGSKEFQKHSTHHIAQIQRLYVFTNWNKMILLSRHHLQTSIVAMGKFLHT